MKLIIDIDEEWYSNIIASKDYIDENDEAYLILNSIPYEERPQGEWIGDTDYESYQGYYEAYKCNRCGYGLHWRDYTNEYKFCPNCGADMRKGGKEDCGKWKFHKDFHESIRYGCNQCGNLTNIPSNFCPNCGKRMKKYEKGGAT